MLAPFLPCLSRFYNYNHRCSVALAPVNSSPLLNPCGMGGVREHLPYCSRLIPPMAISSSGDHTVKKFLPSCLSRLGTKSLRLASERASKGDGSDRSYSRSRLALLRATMQRTPKKDVACVIHGSRSPARRRTAITHTLSAILAQRRHDTPAGDYYFPRKRPSSGTVDRRSHLSSAFFAVCPTETF